MSGGEDMALWVLLVCVAGAVLATCEAIHHEDMDDAFLWYALTLCLIGSVLWLLMCVDADSERVVDWDALHESVMETRD